MPLVALILFKTMPNANGPHNVGINISEFHTCHKSKTWMFNNLSDWRWAFYSRLDVNPLRQNKWKCWALSPQTSRAVLWTGCDEAVLRWSDTFDNFQRQLLLFSGDERWIVKSLGFYFSRFTSESHGNFELVKKIPLSAVCSTGLKFSEITRVKLDAEGQVQKDFSILQWH